MLFASDEPCLRLRLGRYAKPGCAGFSKVSGRDTRNHEGTPLPPEGIRGVTWCRALWCAASQSQGHQPLRGAQAEMGWLLRSRADPPWGRGEGCASSG